MNETFSRQRERFLAVERKFMFMLEGPDDDVPCAKAFQRIALFVKHRRLRQLSAKPKTEKKHTTRFESREKFFSTSEAKINSSLSLHSSFSRDGWGSEKFFSPKVEKVLILLDNLCFLFSLCNCLSIKFVPSPIVCRSILYKK